LSRDRQRLAIRAAALSSKAATVFGKKLDQSVHALEIRAVVEIATVPSADHKSGLNQALQVKRKRRRRQIQALRQFGGGVPLGTALNEEAVHAEACF
jgi:hypothetical protein